MPYCCVPRCKSSSKQRTPGISFHEIPSDPEPRAKWLKVISRDDWTPNATSCYSTVCSRHFGSSDFKEGCKIRELKKDAVPSIFEEYPPYLQPPKKRERSDASVRKREAAAPVNTPPRKRRAVESQLETLSLPGNDLPSVDVASQELSLMDCTASELPLPLENGASERCTTATVQVDRAVQVSSLSSVSAMDKRKWRRKERDLNARIERLKNTVDKYKQELQKLKEECYVSAFLQVVEKAKEKDLAASILVEQVQNFAKKKPTWSELTVRHAVVLRNLSTRAYEHRAVQVFSPPVTAALKLLQEQAGHTCDASFAGVGPTVQFMDTVHRWFVLMDVSNCTQHIHQKNADCKQFESAGDERLIWLETSFLDYLADLKNVLYALQKFVEVLLATRRRMHHPLKEAVNNAAEILREHKALMCSKPGHQENLLKLLLIKFFRPIFTNFALKATDKHDVAKVFEIKPLSRKTLKL
ncbi:hypothetical protein HPB50_029605 [Hyalomma asiaticum]|nr:hypothetical protein HPB50_029605 [Hyalomma asiaticum]